MQNAPNQTCLFIPLTTTSQRDLTPDARRGRQKQRTAVGPVAYVFVVRGWRLAAGGPVAVGLLEGAPPW